MTAPLTLADVKLVRRAEHGTWYGRRTNRPLHTYDVIVRATGEHIGSVTRCNFADGYYGAWESRAFGVYRRLGADSRARGIAEIVSAVNAKAAADVN